MTIDTIPIDVGGNGHITNCYLVYDEHKTGFLVDPADEASKIIAHIVAKDVAVMYIVITHAHGDHIGALASLQRYTNAKVVVMEQDKAALLGEAPNYTQELGVEQQHVPIHAIQTVTDHTVIPIGNMLLECIHTPGHTAGGMCLYEKHEQVLWTGDTLFSDSYGRCDLYSGNYAQMLTSLQMLCDRFSHITIYPGHGDHSSIDHAKRYIRMLIAMKGDRIQ